MDRKFGHAWMSKLARDLLVHVRSDSSLISRGTRRAFPSISFFLWALLISLSLPFAPLSRFRDWVLIYTYIHAHKFIYIYIVLVRAGCACTLRVINILVTSESVSRQHPALQHHELSRLPSKTPTCSLFLYHRPIKPIHRPTWLDHPSPLSCRTYRSTKQRVSTSII